MLLLRFADCELLECEKKNNNKVKEMGEERREKKMGYLRGNRIVIIIMVCMGQLSIVISQR